MNASCATVGNLLIIHATQRKPKLITEVTFKKCKSRQKICVNETVTIINQIQGIISDAPENIESRLPSNMQEDEKINDKLYFNGDFQHGLCQLWYIWRLAPDIDNIRCVIWFMSMVEKQSRTSKALFFSKYETETIVNEEGVQINRAAFTQCGEFFISRVYKEPKHKQRRDHFTHVSPRRRRAPRFQFW